MSKTLYYVFDPLCGWCYGASQVVQELAQKPGVQLQLLPSGLFSNEGARPMDSAFAEYAWANDQRIERLTGQPFSQAYRNDVLANHQKMFDSGPATVALTAVAQTAPDQEAIALKAIQHARYVKGLDITDTQVLVQELATLGLHDAAALLNAPTAQLLEANRQRVQKAQQLLRAVGAHGVPTFIQEQDGQYQLVHANAAFTQPQRFVEQLAA